MSRLLNRLRGRLIDNELTINNIKNIWDQKQSSHSDIQIANFLKLELKDYKILNTKVISVIFEEICALELSERFGLQILTWNLIPSKSLKNFDITNKDIGIDIADIDLNNYFGQCKFYRYGQIVTAKSLTPMSSIVYKIRTNQKVEILTPPGVKIGKTATKFEELCTQLIINWDIMEKWLNLAMMNDSHSKYLQCSNELEIAKNRISFLELQVKELKEQYKFMSDIWEEKDKMLVKMFSFFPEYNKPNIIIYEKNFYHPELLTVSLNHPLTSDDIILSTINSFNSSGLDYFKEKTLYLLTPEIFSNFYNLYYDIAIEFFKPSKFSNSIINYYKSTNNTKMVQFFT